MKLNSLLPPQEAKVSITNVGLPKMELVTDYNFGVLMMLQATIVLYLYVFLPPDNKVAGR